ncbi:hypothetical protein [Alicyclobacillus mengziensis]|uniref:Uncharacterized protein n=1 Tax=Alicyclobacillus mengziensis TaxID=2931921 RepID=A0A9X7W351_9BACL|nr:hypothetical protein [Alicyclobacillus mengziensis]QSO48413.1 hypothetical protein JZ786_05340 [Alicyclobacillus mengziensis]
MNNATTVEKNEFEMTSSQKDLVKRVIECVEECKTDRTRVMFAKQEDYHEYDGREFSARDYGDEERDGYIWVCFNGYMCGDSIQEMSWGDEMTFEDFTSGNYVVPQVFRDFDAIAVKHVAWYIAEEGVRHSSPEEPGGVETDMYYFV